MIQIAVAGSLLVALPAVAEIPTIEQAKARQGPSGWSFDVTLSHPDTGWDHYADGWDVMDQDGTILGQRTLVHPHVNEQPFTRSLSGVVIPDGVERVFIRARCLVDGWGEPVFEIALDDAS